MKRWLKVLIIILASLATVVLAIFIISILIRNKIGDIRPVILPVIKPKTGQSVDYLKPPVGYKIGIYAKNLGNARDLTFSPKMTLLVSATADGKIIAMPDKNNDGIADESKIILSGLNKPHGIAFYNGRLYVAEENKVSRYEYDENLINAKKDKDIIDLPSGGRHFTRSLVFRNDKMYVSVGSTCDICVEKNPINGSVIEVDPNEGYARIFAEGLRNAVFMTVKDDTKQIFATEMGRDFLGDDLPPDELDIIDKGNYGWPYCYGDKIVDKKFDTNHNCSKTVEPLYNIPAHSAPLGLTFISSVQMPNQWQNNLLIAYHGSWNRSQPTGYKIVKLVTDDNIVKSTEDFITGFLQGSQVIGRPVDLTFDNQGSLYISDDKAGVIYKMIKNE